MPFPLLRVAQDTEHPGKLAELAVGAAGRTDGDDITG